MLRLPLIDRLKFYLERQLAKGAFYQLVVAWLLVVLVSLFGGALVTAFHGPAETYLENIWWAFLRLTDPGYLGDDEGMLRRVVSTVLTVLGYVLFMGTLVAIMTQWLTAKMRTLEQGLTPVALRHHISILGWTSRTIPILQDILARGPLDNGAERKRKRTRIAVLADDITQGASSEFYSHRELSAKRRQVILRSGSMLNPDHMLRVAAGSAKVVIIPSPADTSGRLLSADSEAIKVLLSLNAQSTQATPPLAIVELQNADNIALARHSYQGPLQIVASDIAIARAFSQSVVSPGVSEVLDSLLVDANGCQLYLAPATAVQGQRWGDISQFYQASIACGVVSKQGGHATPLLNPKQDYIIGADDQLILLAREEKDIVYLGSAGHQQAHLASVDLSALSLQRERARVLVLGWNRRVPRFIEQLQAAFGQDLTLTSVSTSSRSQRRQLVNDSHAQLEFIEADYTRASVLSDIELNQFDTVVVFATDRLERGEEADARSIVANQLLDLLLQNASQRPQVLVELIDPNNNRYVSASKHRLRSEVVQSSAIISHLLAQLAVYPDLRSVYDSLLSPEGVGVRLKSVPSQWFGQPSFRQLQQAVAAQGDILIGIKQDNQRSELNLSPDALVDANATTALIVIGN